MNLQRTMAGALSAASAGDRSNFTMMQACARHCSRIAALRVLSATSAMCYSLAGQRRPVGLPNGAFQMEAAKIYFIIFGLLTIAGGIIGYVKAGSTASIIAGGITGVLLIVAAFLLPEHRVAGLATALIISVLLAGQFVPKFFRTGRIMPAGMMSVLSVIGIIAAIVAWVRK